MHNFEFLEPRTVGEASGMLAEFGEDCRLMGGGTALMLVMRQRMLLPTHIVSVARIDRLRGISFDPQRGLRIGGLSRHCDVARSEAVRTHYPMLAAMAAQVANPQVRHQGTIAGNVCYGDPSTDPPTCLMALDARIVLESRRGVRELSLEEFLVDFFETAIEPDEVLVEILVPPPSALASGHYTRFRRTAAEHRPLVNVGIAVERRGAECLGARIVVGASTPVPARVARAEEALTGRRVTADLIEEVGQIVGADILAISDSRGTEAYRRAMAQAAASRTLNQLFFPEGEAP